LVTWEIHGTRQWQVVTSGGAGFGLAWVSRVLESREAGSTYSESHQTWQLNEISKLIWPSPKGIGTMDEDLWAQTVAVAIEGEVISEEPSEGACRTDLAMGALEALGMSMPDTDVTGDMWEPVEEELRPGGD